MNSQKFTSVDEYINSASPVAQLKLTEIRTEIKKIVPEAKEIISYNMPAFKHKGILVYYAAYKKHIGFYPTGSGIKAFEMKLNGYKYSKGAIQFPMDKPLPIDLIKEIVLFRWEENNSK